MRLVVAPLHVVILRHLADHVYSQYPDYAKVFSAIDVSARQSYNSDMAKRRKKPETPTQLVRRLVQESESKGIVARDSGVNRQNLYKFASGEAGISGDGLDKLTAYFGLVLK